MNYVVLTKPRIGEVMRGEANVFYVDVPAQLGTRIAVKTARNRRPTCLVEVAACEPNTGDESDAAYTLTVRVCPLEHEPLFLAQDSTTPFRDGSGYTTDPTKALRGEPEAIWVHELGTEWKSRAERRHEKATIERVEDARQLRSMLSHEQRITNLRQAARFNNVDVSSEVFLIKRAIRKRRNETTILQHIAAAERRAYREQAA